MEDRTLHARSLAMVAHFHPAGLARADATGHGRRDEGLNKAGRRVEAQAADAIRECEWIRNVHGDEVGPRRQVRRERAALNFDIMGQRGERRVRGEQQRDGEMTVEREVGEGAKTLRRTGDEQEVCGPGRQAETTSARADEVERITRLQRRAWVHGTYKELQTAVVRMEWVERDAEKGLGGAAGPGQIKLPRRSRQFEIAAAPDTKLSAGSRDFGHTQGEVAHAAMVS
jgi:hypothetical protein